MPTHVGQALPCHHSIDSHIHVGSIGISLIGTPGEMQPSVSYASLSLEDKEKTIADILVKSAIGHALTNKVLIMFIFIIAYMVNHF